MTLKSDRWNPRLRGETYCSPACGGKKGFCTLAAYEKATARALEVVADLGPGWKPEVFENLGWHCSVVSLCRRISVHVYEDHCLAILGSAEEQPAGQWTASGKTAREAVSNVFLVARESLAWLLAPFELGNVQLPSGDLLLVSARPTILEFAPTASVHPCCGCSCHVCANGHEERYEKSHHTKACQYRFYEEVVIPSQRKINLAYERLEK